MRYLSGKDKKNLQKELLSTSLKIDKKDEIIEFNNIIFKNKNPLLIKSEVFKNIEEFDFLTYIPHLKSLEVKELKSITIDVGAVPFLLKGVDMMRPGITSIQDNIEKHEIIRIIDEVKGLTIGVGISLYSSDEMNNLKTGKVVKTLHYFKDSLYNTNL